MSNKAWVLPRAHRGYLIKRTLLGDIWIERDGHFISYAQSVEDAMRLIEDLHEGAKR
jgi:hypothetical protein